MARRLLVLALLAALSRTASADPANWPQFRGPSGQGLGGDQELPVAWSQGEGIVWQTPLSGRGWSSPVIAEGRIWITVAEATEAADDQRQAMLKTVEKYPIGDEMVAYASIQLCAVEFDLESGSQLRKIELFKVDAPPPIHGLNTYASPTPILADGRCYCHFGTFGTACVDCETGEVLWRQRLEIDHIVGPGSSPALVGDKLIIPCDGADRQFVVALNAADGEIAWQVNRPPIRNTNGDNRKAFSTPLVIDVGGRTQVVIPGAQWFVAYDPADGKEIWRVDHGSGFSNVPRPVFDGQTVYLITGFGRPQLWAVRADGAGDVTDTHVVWRESQQVPAMSSPVVADGRLYMVSDNGVATCLDTADGKTLWRERVGGKFSASPLLAGGRIYLCSHEGRTTVVAAEPTYQVVAENDLEGMLMASPAVADGDLILRSDTHLVRIGQP
jgi:hypothetical protein